MEPLTKDEINTVINDPDADRFCFASKSEFLLYIREYKKAGGQKNVIWENKSTYMDLFMQGFRLYDNGQYEKAIAIFRRALKVNPIGLNTRFEICECYLKLGNLLGARTALLELQPYLVEKPYIARFYRRLGYIAIEQKEYRLAAACFLFSLDFEKSKLAAEELLYIHSAAGELEPVEDLESFIQASGIPVLKADDQGRKQETVYN